MYKVWLPCAGMEVGFTSASTDMDTVWLHREQSLQPRSLFNPRGEHALFALLEDLPQCATCLLYGYKIPFLPIASSAILLVLSRAAPGERSFTTRTHISLIHCVLSEKPGIT